MKDMQLRQVNKLAQQLLLPDESSKRAAVCLAHLVKPENSVVGREALAVLLAGLEPSKPTDTRKAAAWALAGLAPYVSTEDLSNRIVPRLIQLLDEGQPGSGDFGVARQAYQSLNHIGTPDAMMATEIWFTRMKNLHSQAQ